MSPTNFLLCADMFSHFGIELPYQFSGYGIDCPYDVHGSREVEYLIDNQWRGNETNIIR